MNILRPSDVSVSELQAVLRQSTAEDLGELSETELAVCRSHYARVHGIVNKRTGEVIPINCKSWRCPVHRKSWLHKWTTIVSRETRVNPIDRLITLTCAGKATPSQLNEARKSINEKIRYYYGTYEYVSVLEFTSVSRLPHLHILGRSVYLPQKDLSSMWAAATRHAGIKRSTVVYIEAPRSQEGSTVYALAYALNGESKGQDVPIGWRGRKITYSHGFFQSKRPSEHWNDYIRERFDRTELSEWEVVPTSITAIKEKTFGE